MTETAAEGGRETGLVWRGSGIPEPNTRQSYPQTHLLLGTNRLTLFHLHYVNVSCTLIKNNCYAYLIRCNDFV